MSECTRCPLHESALTVCIGGRGPAKADIMIVGEAPGSSEDMEGTPFVGAAGMKLNALLGKAGIEPASVRISNAVRCRPPKNRDPQESEVEACRVHLRDEIAAVEPSAIVAMGNTAIYALTWASGISRMRGRIMPLDSWFNYTCSVWPTYHPAATLYAHGLNIERNIVADLTNVRNWDRVTYSSEPKETGCRFHVGRAGGDCGRCGGTWA